MSDNFKQTVDLKEQVERARHPERAPDRPRPTAAKKSVKPAPRIEKKPDRQKAWAIDQVYNEDEIIPQKELQTISYPKQRAQRGPMYKNAALIIAGLVIVAFVYWQFIHQTPAGNPNSPGIGGTGWYSVKLLNDEIYYGEIGDTTADPVIIKNVYYNYDQLNQDSGTVNESGNLRLVKRGKETHGPDGTMSVVRAQVVFMEPLKEDSRVLKAILDYEK